MYDIHLLKRHVESLVSGPCPFSCPLSAQVPRIPFPAPDPTIGVKFSRNTLLISCLEIQTEKAKMRGSHFHTGQCDFRCASR